MGQKEAVYFDSFGQPPQQIVEDFCNMKMPYCSKDIQFLMSPVCSWYCLVFLHFLISSKHRTGNLYTDSGLFTDLFDDLIKSTDHLKNEFIPKHFFRSDDPKKRRHVSCSAKP